MIQSFSFQTLLSNLLVNCILSATLSVHQSYVILIFSINIVSFDFIELAQHDKILNAFHTHRYLQ